MGNCTGFFIEKIELAKKATKLNLIYYHGSKEGAFRIASGTTLRSGDKQWKLIKADGIKLDEWTFPKDGDNEFVTRFVLNFQPIDKSVETIDFVEDDDLNSFIFYDIALTDKAAEEIKRRISVPDGVKNYAKNIKDNGQSLDKNEFSMEPATVKGTIYGFDKRCFGTRMSGDVTVYIYNPFYGDQLSYSAPINPDNTFEIEVPMTTKNQIAYLSIDPVISNNVLLTSGKTVVVDYDFYEVYKPWELPNRSLNPYFSGENADLNYALTKSVVSDFFRTVSDGEIVEFSMAEYKDFIIKNYTIFKKKIDTLDITKRGKELLDIDLKSEMAYLLSMGQHFIESANVRPSGGKEPNPNFKRPEMGKDYLDYPKILVLDEINMFYANMFSYNITGWWGCANRVFGKNLSWEEYKNLVNQTWKELDSYTDIPENEKPVLASFAEKLEKADTTRTENEKAFFNKYRSVVDKHMMDIQRDTEDMDACKNEVFGSGDSFFKDFIKLQDYCYSLNRQTAVPDSIVAEIEKMRFPFYAEYIKAQNAAITAKIEAEKARGGYFTHQAGESEGDSLFVDLLKDFKGKVVLIDFWNTWCGPCRSAIKQMEPMEKSFEGKDVVFLYLADESSPLEEYNNVIVSMKGHHYRLTSKQSTSLKNKWKFSGIPSYVIVGRDGMVKDFHTGFHGADYYKAKLEEELGK